MLLEIRVEPEALRAPTSGVIAAARVVPGQVVQAQDVLFQIVDPASLWVEALVYGELDPAALGAATATAPGRPPLTLRFQGFSHALQQHAVGRAVRGREPAAQSQHRPAGQRHRAQAASR